MQNTGSKLKSMDLPFPPLSVYLFVAICMNKSAA